jgi:hypothetical protein
MKMPSIPPGIEGGFSTKCKQISNLIDQNYEKLVQSFVEKALQNAQIEPKIRTSTLMSLAQKFLIPQVQKFEGGWADHPSDSGGPTMRGVISSTFQGNFVKLFINATKDAGLDEISLKAAALKREYPNVAGGDRRGEYVKGALYTMLSSEKVASLFIWSFLCSSTSGYPIAVMAEDAWLGYIQFEMCWGGGPNAVFGDSGKAYYDGVAKQKYGRTEMGTTGWVKWIANDLGPSKAPEFAVACFSSQIGFFDRISRPGNKNNAFRKGWFNRLINWPTSLLKMCIIVNEVFNKNSTGMFEFDEKEIEFLTQKAKIYESLIIKYPTGG